MRTLEQFVADLRKRGKTRKQILSVALCTRWESRREDIKKMLEESKNAPRCSAET